MMSIYIHTLKNYQESLVCHVKNVSILGRVWSLMLVVNVFPLYIVCTNQVLFQQQTWH